MKILFVSALSGDLSVGPSYSVPAQISAQSVIDDVLWINTTNKFRDEWKEFNIPYLSGEQYKNIRLEDIIMIFGTPDIVFFEGCYNYPFFKLISDIKNSRIPYLLVPRSQLTEKAQKNKMLKKWFANILFFNGFINRASAIQYLTNQEAEESKKWRPKAFIIPNGITPREYSKKNINVTDGIKIVYIGRIDIYQKGLDLLIEACSMIKEYLEKRMVKISLFGKATEGDQEKLQNMISNYGLSSCIEIRDPAFGDDKFFILENTDIFVMTSRFEGMPMGLIEALSFSCPCLITPGTNMGQEVRQYDAGWVANEDVESIASSIKEAIENFATTHMAKSYNANVLSKNYTWKSIADETHRLCESLINE